jgi:hypothetical protein
LELVYLLVLLAVLSVALLVVQSKILRGARPRELQPASRQERLPAPWLEPRLGPSVLDWAPDQAR